MVNGQSKISTSQVLKEFTPLSKDPTFVIPEGFSKVAMMAGGIFLINTQSKEEIDKFCDLVSETSENPFSFVGQHTPGSFEQVYIDIDVGKVPMPSKEDKDILIKGLASTCLDCLKRVNNLSKPPTVWVMCRPGPNDKFGLHVFLANVYLDPVDRVSFLACLTKRLERSGIFSQYGNPVDIVDLCVAVSTGQMIYTCSKPNTSANTLGNLTPYQVTAIYGPDMRPIPFDPNDPSFRRTAIEKMLCCIDPNNLLITKKAKTNPNDVSRWVELGDNATEEEIEDEKYVLEIRNKYAKKEERRKAPTTVMTKPVFRPRSEQDGPVGADDSPFDPNDKIAQLLLTVMPNTPKSVSADGIKTPRYDYHKWLVVCLVLLTNGYPKSLWLAWSDMYEQSNEARKLWDNLSRTVNYMVSVNTLYSMAKERDLGKYQEWVMRHKTYVSLKVLRAGVMALVDFLLPRFYQKMRYCNGTWYGCNSITNVWGVLPCPVDLIITTFQSGISDAISSLTFARDSDPGGEFARTKYSSLLKEYCDQNAKMNQSSIYSTASKILCTKLNDPMFNNILNSNVGKITFRDGIYDMRTGSFRKGIRDTDFVSKTLDYPYERPEKETMDWVLDELQPIFNNSRPHMMYVLSFLAYALTGESGDIQQFLHCYGPTAQNGKSTLLLILMKLFPIYVHLTQAAVFEAGNTQTHKSIANWHGVRILWANEVGTRPLNVELMNILCDGGNIAYNKLYGNQEYVNFIGKFICISNNSPVISNFGHINKGIIRRLYMAEFRSTFGNRDCPEELQFVGDPKFNEKMLNDDAKMGLVQILLDLANEYYTTRKLRPYPEDWARLRQDVIEDSNQFNTWFNDTFVVGKDLKIPIAHFSAMLKTTFPKMTMTAAKDVMKAQLIQFTFDKSKILNGQKGWIDGFGMADLSAMVGSGGGFGTGSDE